MKKYIAQGVDTVRDAPVQYKSIYCVCDDYVQFPSETVSDLIELICSSVPSDVVLHFVFARG